MTAWQPKKSGSWDRMGYAQRVAYIAELDDAQLVAQARVRAAASGRTVSEVLIAWVLNGYLSYERKNAVVRELEA